MILLLSYVVFSLGAGYMAGVQPSGAGWRDFSWHPFLMTCAFVGAFGAAAVTKKRGGYTNTKAHGILAWLGNFLALGGLYAIYNHKNSIGKAHFQTTHSIAGLVVLGGCFMSGMAGGVFLHPDFGMDKTNKTIRFAHMWMSRFVLIIAWFNAFIGLTQLTEDPTKLAAYGLPLLALLFPSFM
jgi:hypothetical protein